MDIFSQNKLLVRVVFILIIINLISLSYVWFHDRRPNQPYQNRQEKENGVRLLRKQLQLTDEQANEFIRIRNDFSKKEEALSSLVKARRDSMNLEMFNEITDTIRLHKLAKQLATDEYQLELYRIEQSQQLKSICTKEQLTNFRNLVRDMRDFFQPRRKKE